MSECVFEVKEIRVRIYACLKNEQLDTICVNRQRPGRFQYRPEPAPGLPCSYVC